MADSQLSENVSQASRQQQFLNVVSRDVATEKFQSQLSLLPLGVEFVPLSLSHGRVLAEEIIAPIDVPGFDRSNVDGFAVIASETAGAMEETPRSFRLNNESLIPGNKPALPVLPGTATPISTGGMIPRGADAVVMIEETDVQGSEAETLLEISRSVPPGHQITFAGSDIAKGETVLWSRTLLTSREIGVLASLGVTTVPVFRKPLVAIISTGDEVVPPGEALPVGCVYDSNAAILSAAVAECGGEPIFLGRAKDDLAELEVLMSAALQYDVVLLSGGTSKGAGDLSYQIVQRFTDPGIVAHGVALKPGKPICLAVTQGKPVVILPGFPTSAIFTFHEFVAPVLRILAGHDSPQPQTVSAQMPIRLNSERGKTEYLLVRLFESQAGRFAYPMGKGSGSVTTFSLADGFITIPQHVEIVDAGTAVDVTLLDAQLRTADFVVIGSHCTGLDYLLSQLHRSGVKTSVLHVGSEAGLAAVRRGECHMAGVHLLDEQTNTYNATFLGDDLALIPGYSRMQCFVCRKDDLRFAVDDAQTAIQNALCDSTCTMVNRNPGSGTRILTDQLLLQSTGPRKGQKPSPAGYAHQVKSHNAVAAAISQGRADWGIAIESVAKSYGLKTLTVREEHYDFIVRHAALDHPAVQRFCELLEHPSTLEKLASFGFDKHS